MYSNGMQTDKYRQIGKELLEQSIEFISFDEVLQRGIDELDATRPEEIVSFGYPWLDDKMTGIFKGELVVFGGEAGTGKTTFATNIVYKASKTHKCAILALEDRLPDYGMKAIYFEIGRLRKAEGKKNYPWNAYRRNEIDDPNYKTLRDTAKANLSNTNIHFGDVKKQMDIETLENVLREQVNNGVQLFLIDHLHYFDLLKGDSSKADYVEKVMVSLKTIQNQTGARVLLVVHYRKLNGQKPSLDSFKDSISIVQNANYVINLWRDRTLKDEDISPEDKYKTSIFVPKSRNPNGEFTVDVVFDPSSNDYKNPETYYGTPTTETQAEQTAL